MAAGDAQRVWFGQMVDRLREGSISSPVFRCRDCGYAGPGATPHVSVRAMVLSLTRFGIAPAEQIHALEKQWSAYRKQNDLDPYGKQTASRQIENSPCNHG
jgi:hypothetical protein